MNGQLHLKCQSHIIYFAGGQSGQRTGIWPIDAIY